MKYIITVLCLVSFTAFSHGDKGNGADAWVCRVDGKVKSVELTDHYEGKSQWDTKVKYKGNQDAKEYVIDILSKIEMYTENSEGFKGKLVSEALKLFSDIEDYAETRNEDLKYIKFFDLGDFSDSFYEAKKTVLHNGEKIECEPLQFIFRSEDRYSEEKEYSISKEILDIALENNDWEMIADAIKHEAIYKAMIGLLNKKYSDLQFRSRHIRYINAKTSNYSKSSMFNFVEFLKLANAEPLLQDKKFRANNTFFANPYEKSEYERVAYYDKQIGPNLFRVCSVRNTCIIVNKNGKYQSKETRRYGGIYLYAFLKSRKNILTNKYVRMNFDSQSSVATSNGSIIFLPYSGGEINVEVEVSELDGLQTRLRLHEIDRSKLEDATHEDLSSHKNSEDIVYLGRRSEGDKFKLKFSFDSKSLRDLKFNLVELTSN